MKIRNGFVSNSSSSSFIVIGYEFDSFEDFKMSLNNSNYNQVYIDAKKNGLVISSDILNNSKGNEDVCVVGAVLAEAWENIENYTAFSLRELNSKAKTLHNFMEKWEIPCTDKELKIINYLAGV